MKKIVVKKIVNRFIRRPFPAIALLTLSLVGCAEGAVPGGQTVDFGDADRVLSIQPIQVCDDSGNHCAKVNMFEDITRRILAQAKLKVSFLPIHQLRASRFLKIDKAANLSSSDYEFYELSRTGEAGAFGRNSDSTRTSGPINVWFVDEIEAADGFTQFGLAWIDANGVLISAESGTFNGTGRPDTLAHEIGHNLGLHHGTDPNNLLTDGSRRNIPTSVEDIGSVSQLTDAQIAEIKRSGFLTNNSNGSPGTEIASANDIIDDMTPQETTQAVRSLINATTLPMNAPTKAALVSTAITNATAIPETVPEPNSWAAISLFAILIAARKKSPTEAVQ